MSGERDVRDGGTDMVSVFSIKRSLKDEGDPDLVRREIARAKEGDPEALHRLYERYADNVFSYVRSIIHDDHEAEDVTQHVFTKLLTRIAGYEERSVPFTAWLFGSPVTARSTTCAAGVRSAARRSRRSTARRSMRSLPIGGTRSRTRSARSPTGSDKWSSCAT